MYLKKYHLFHILLEYPENYLNHTIVAQHKHQYTVVLDRLKYSLNGQTEFQQKHIFEPRILLYLLPKYRNLYHQVLDLYNHHIF